MKSSTLALPLLALLAGSHSVQAASLAVDVGDNIKVGDLLMVAVYADHASWLKKPARALRQTVPAQAQANGRHRVALEELAPGRYALAVYVDSNGNGKLDRGMFGIPKEPYGFSQGGGSMGPPDFSEAAVEVPEAGATIHIKLR
jgi:uncharacterized protein (DUF2141 family)